MLVGYVKCSCGKETVVPSNSLLKGNTSSCGCGSLENARKQGGVNIEEAIQPEKLPIHKQK